MSKGSPGAGDQLGRYRLDREIGRGGMGVVWQAHDTLLDRRVALKLINPDVAQDDVFRMRFAREMKVAARLAHPNIVPVHETGTIDGQLFIAMQFVDGEDLRGRLRRMGSLGTTATARIATQLGAALDAAHSQGLVHRDVKPANVLLGGDAADAHAYLSDFGLAREAASDSGLTNSGSWLGTIDYVSPEQIDGGAVSARSDVYAMGCLLFQTLTGQVPFVGSLAQKIKAHGSHTLPSVGLHGGEHTAEIDLVLARATEKIPDRRFASAGDLGYAFAAAVRGDMSHVPDRTVATGSALYGTTVGHDRHEDPTVAAAAGPTPTVTMAKRTPREPIPTSPVPEPPRRRRRGWGMAVAGLLLATVAAGGLAAVYVTSQDDGGGTATAADGPTATRPVPSTSSAGAQAKNLSAIVLNIGAPTDASRIPTASATVRGTVSPASARVYIQSHEAEVVDGRFSGTAAIHYGTTRIDVVATAAGAEAASRYVVVRRDRPTVTTTVNGVPTTEEEPVTDEPAIPALDRQLTGGGYQVSLPTSGGWSVGEPSVGASRTLTTRKITGPDDETILFIHSKVPADPGSKKTRSDEPFPSAARSRSRHLVLFDWYTPECQGRSCTDFVMNDPSWGGIAILANGLEGSTAYDMAVAIAQSVRPFSN